MSTKALDEARAVREGERLDEAALGDWLRANVPGLSGPLEVRQFPGGHSNLTYLVRVGERELVLRRPPFGSKVKTAHDMGREHRILSRLHDAWPLAPAALAACDDLSVLGAPFYVMERVQGVILRSQKAPEGLELSEAVMRRLSERLVDHLADLHAVDVDAAGLGDLGRPEGYVERQVRGWRERWEKAKTDEMPDVDRAAAWLADHQPPERGAALIHNDFKYDNLVLDPEDLTRVKAVLDWEMATVGDPLMDLGTTLGYWVDPDDPEPMRLLPVGPTVLPGNLDRAGLVRRYAERSGRDVSDALFYYVFGLFKIAVIAQQIYYRYEKGLTRDERFATLIFGVALLGQQAVRAIDLGRLDRLHD